MSFVVSQVSTGGSVSLLAGDGTAGYVEATGIGARFTKPRTVELFGTKLYVVDSDAQRVRAVTTPGAVTSLYAGDGVVGFIDGATPRFNYPRGLACTAAGIAFVADGGNYAIRKIALDQSVTTVAGTGASGAADSMVGVHATMGFVFDVHLTAAGSLYFIDFHAGAVRVLDTGTNAVTTLQTGIASPMGVAANADGSQVFAGNHAGYLVYSYGAPAAPTASPSAPTVPTLSWTIGNGTAGMKDGTLGDAFLDGPNDVVIDPVTSELVVANYDMHYVCRITPAGRSNRFAGDGVAGMLDGITTAARLNRPSGCSVDSNGVTYIASYYAHAVVQVSIGGSLTNFAGSGTLGYNEGSGAAAQFHFPMFVAVAGTTSVYVSDQYNHVLRKIAVAGAATSLVAGTPTTLGFIDGPATSARFWYPSGIAFTAAGVTFMADVYNYGIRKIALDLSVTTLAGTGAVGSASSAYGVQASFYEPSALFLWSDSHLFVGDYKNQKIRVVDISTGFVSDFISGSGVGNSPGVTSNAAGTSIYVASRSTHQIMVFGVTPTPPTASPSAPTTPTLSWAIGNGTAGMVDGSLAVARIDGPRGASTDPVTGEIVVTIFSGHAVARISTSGRLNRFLGDGTAANTDGITVNSQVYAPAGSSVAANGVTYVTSWSGHHLLQVSTGGSLTLFVGASTWGYVEGSGASAKFHNPFGVAVFGASTVYVADYGSHVVRKVAVSGTTTSLAAGEPLVSGFIDGPASRFKRPSAVAPSSSGILYVADYSNYAIRKLALDLSVSTIAGTGVVGNVNSAFGVQARFDTPYGMCLVNDAYLLVSENYAKQVRLVDVSSGVVSTFITTSLIANGLTSNADGTMVHLASRENQVLAFGVPVGPTASQSPPASPSLSWVVGSGGTGRVDGALGAAQVYGPHGVATDPLTDEAIVAMYSDNYVSRINAVGVSTRFVGDGTAASTDGVGVSAQVNTPIEVAIDSAGTMYISSYLGHVIVQVTTGGSLTNFVGSGAQGYVEGSGGAAQLYRPCAVKPVGTAEVYFVDRYNHIVRKVTVSGATSAFVAGTVSTAGFVDGPAAQACFHHPQGLARTAAGIMYVTDSTNNAVRKIALDVSVSTLAGTGATGSANSVFGVQASFHWPKALALDPTEKFLFVADDINNKVRLVETTSGVVTDYLTLAALNRATGITVNAAGTTMHVTSLAGNQVLAFGTVTPTPTGTKTVSLPAPTTAVPVTTAPPSTTVASTTAAATAVPTTATATAVPSTSATTSTPANTTSVPATAAPTTTTAAPGSNGANSDSSSGGVSSQSSAAASDCAIGVLECWLFILLVALGVAALIVFGCVMYRRALRSRSDELKGFDANDRQGEAVRIEADGAGAGDADTVAVEVDGTLPHDDEDEDW
jgi:DNA-binding beta-propeller fold protein YncE